MALRESPSSAPPAVLGVGSSVIVDCGRARDLIVFDAGKQTHTVRRQQIRLQSLLGEQVGRGYTIEDRQGTLRRRAPAQLTEEKQPTAATEAADADDDNDGSERADGDADEPSGQAEESSSAQESERRADAFSSSLPAAVSVSTGRLLASSSLPASLLPTATNAELYDNNSAQRLSQSEIAAASAQRPVELISLLLQHSATHASKTEYSQEKYIAKKKRKHMTELHTLSPALVNVIDTVLLKDSAKLAGLRLDTISQILYLANLRPRGVFLIAESLHGNLLSALAHKTAGLSTILHINPSLPQAVPEMPQLGLFSSQLSAQEKSTIISLPFSLLADFDSIENCADKYPQYADGIEILQRGVIDSLILCSRYDCVDLFSACFPYLRAGGYFVVHCSFVTPLAALHKTLRQSGLAVMVQLSESWYREYQVLPNRTHPAVNMSHAAGYLLSGIKMQPAAAAQ